MKSTKKVSKEENPLRLFRVMSVVNVRNHIRYLTVKQGKMSCDKRNYNDVEVSWNIIRDSERTLEVNYKNLIKDYKPRNTNSIYPESYIQELFTFDEAIVLVKFLVKVYGVKSTIYEINLPIENNRMGDCSMSVGGDSGCIQLSKEPKYNLAFKVEGFFHLQEGHESKSNTPTKSEPVSSK